MSYVKLLSLSLSTRLKSSPRNYNWSGQLTLPTRPKKRSLCIIQLGTVYLNKSALWSLSPNTARPLLGKKNEKNENLIIIKNDEVSCCARVWTHSFDEWGIDKFALQNSVVWSPATDMGFFPCKKAKNLAGQNMDKIKAKIKGNEWSYRILWIVFVSSVNCIE